MAIGMLVASQGFTKSDGKLYGQGDDLARDEDEATAGEQHEQQQQEGGFNNQDTQDEEAYEEALSGSVVWDPDRVKRGDFSDVRGIPDDDAPRSSSGSGDSAAKDGEHRSGEDTQGKGEGQEAVASVTRPDLSEEELERLAEAVTREFVVVD
ncbi:hypothetical protein VTI74DRAFT_8512 [Chaetomium olivicolor]